MKPSIKLVPIGGPSTSGTPSSSKYNVGVYCKPHLSPALAARKSVLKRIRKQELRRLQALIPKLSSCHHAVDELKVVEEATRYIQQLRSTIIAKINAGSLPSDALSKFTLPSPRSLQDQLRHEQQQQQNENKHQSNPHSSKQ